MPLQMGMYRGRVIAGSEQWTESRAGNLQLVLNVEMWPEGMEQADGTVTASTVLTFTEKSEQYEFERLQACGWPGGEFPAKHLPALDANEVPIEVRTEMFEGKETTKVQIRARGAGITIKDDRLLGDAQLRKYQAVYKGRVSGAARPSASAAAGNGANRPKF